MSRQVSASKSSKQQQGGRASMQPARPPTMRPTHPNSTQSSVRHMQPAAQPSQHYNQEMIQPPPAPGPRSSYTPQQMHSAPGKRMSRTLSDSSSLSSLPLILSLSHPFLTLPVAVPLPLSPHHPPHIFSSPPTSLLCSK